jgi:YHS domain-containing protein
MEKLDALDRRIKERLAVSEEALQLRQNHTQRSMREWEDRCVRYTVTADRLMQQVVRPRAERLKDHFPNASQPEARNSRHTCFLQFAHTPRFPATVGLELGVTRDGQASHLIVQYRLEILPVFFPFEGRDEITFTLNDVDEAKVAAWVEDRILRFVDTYLRLETAEPYQAENLTTDPVCGMQVNKVHAPAVLEYDGTTYYFCLEECRDRFGENPKRYLSRDLEVRP